MFEDDFIYQQIVIEKKGRGGLAVEENGYLEILHMNVIKHDFIMYDNAFSIEYEDNTPYIGSLSDSVNDGELAHTLESSINTMFNIDHHAGSKASPKTPQLVSASLQSSTVSTPQASASSRPQAPTSSTPQESTSTRPQASISSRPQASTFTIHQAFT
ncbi:uncharacterized protein TNCV_3275471 [Trichonephila clavipes]|nr:uncharacterized protein TNCV_3275471 [Trichonephila clavipes]